DNVMDVDLFDDFISNFNAKKTFRRAVEAVQAANRLRSGLKTFSESDGGDTFVVHGNSLIPSTTEQTFVGHENSI
ncbi:12215_t:CDS:1, partial [Acaulospora morrowiae]